MQHISEMAEGWLLRESVCVCVRESPKNKSTEAAEAGLEQDCRRVGGGAVGLILIS
jgi:hypothetical protein